MAAGNLEQVKVLGIREEEAEGRCDWMQGPRHRRGEAKGRYAITALTVALIVAIVVVSLTVKGFLL